MKTNVTYRGKTATLQDIEDINREMKNNPGISRRKLSAVLCELWNWRQANGSLRDMVCRSFLLELERAGYITLPARKVTPNNPLFNRKKPAKIKVNKDPISGKLSLLKPFTFIQVRGTDKEKVFNSIIEEYHYLGYSHPVGEQLKYLIYWNERPVACFSWSSAPRHIGSRDRFIGWNQRMRKVNLKYMAYNTRFLILPWVKVKYLASHLLSETVKRISEDWNAIYNHPVYYLETFVDKSLFKGTCYYAANWKYLGDTTGRGKDDQTRKANRSIKAVLGYPLVKNFREKMS